MRSLFLIFIFLVSPLFAANPFACRLAIVPPLAPQSALTRASLTAEKVVKLRETFWRAAGAFSGEVVRLDETSRLRHFESPALANFFHLPSKNFTLVSVDVNRREEPTYLALNIPNGDRLLVPVEPFFAHLPGDDLVRTAQWRILNSHRAVFSSYKVIPHLGLNPVQLLLSGDSPAARDRGLVQWWPALWFEEFWGEPVEFPVLGNVYPPYNPYVSALLRAAADRARGSDSVLVLGSGSGADAVTLARIFGARVDAVDLDPAAVLNTVVSATLYDVADRVTAWESRSFERVVRRYRHIFANLPLIAPDAEPGGDSRKIDPAGDLIIQLLNELPARLEPGGAFYVMTDARIAEFLIFPRWLKVTKLLDVRYEKSAPADIPATAIFEVTVRGPVSRNLVRRRK